MKNFVMLDPFSKPLFELSRFDCNNIKEKGGVYIKINMVVYTEPIS